MKTSICTRKKHPLDCVLTLLIYLSTNISILILIGIISYVVYKGLPSINLEFLTKTQSTLHNTFGILGNIINTFYIMILTLCIATPIGIGAAIYLTEYAKPGRFVRLIEFTTEILAGIPSIIYGLFGMVFFGIQLKLGFSILCGAFTLSLMVLPLIIRTTQEALKAVPLSYRIGALGMGATKWYMIRTIILPSALPGIITAIILSIGRIVGESAALLFTAGSGFLIPQFRDCFSHIFSSGGTLTIQMYLSMSKAEYEHAFGIAFILILIVLFVNILTKLITNKLTPSVKSNEN